MHLSESMFGFILAIRETIDFEEVDVIECYYFKRDSE